MNTEKIQKITSLLYRLKHLLISVGENNWLNGVNAAIVEISSESDESFNNARSIYKTMTAGGRGFSEYYICLPDGKYHEELNSILDEIRSELWKEFH